MKVDYKSHVSFFLWHTSISVLSSFVSVFPELSNQHVCKEEEVLADQQLCDQERNSSLNQEESEPPHIKEEEEELSTSQEEEQFVLEKESENLVMTPTHEESDHEHTQGL